jgi:hypothetical protein
METGKCNKSRIGTYCLEEYLFEHFFLIRKVEGAMMLPTNRNGAIMRGYASDVIVLFPHRGQGCLEKT